MGDGRSPSSAVLATRGRVASSGCGDLTKEALREAPRTIYASVACSSALRPGGEHPRTLDEVGRTFNVTRERIRQIENQSLKKLQSLAEAQKLRDVA